MTIGRKVLPHGRSSPRRDPYATIRADLLGCATYRALSGAAMRIHVMLEANFNPNHELILPHKMAIDHLQMSPNSVTACLAELTAALIVEKVRDGIRPGRMGGQSEGRAAVYRLPHRDGDAIPRWKRDNDPKLRGAYRIHCEKLRHLAAQLSANEMKLFLYFQAVDRNADGSPLLNEDRTISSAQAGIPKATLQRVLVSLMSKGKIERTVDGIGKRPARYRLHAAEAKGIKAGKMKKSRNSGGTPNRTTAIGLGHKQPSVPNQ